MSTLSEHEISLSWDAAQESNIAFDELREAEDELKKIKCIEDIAASLKLVDFNLDNEVLKCATEERDEADKHFEYLKGFAGKIMMLADGPFSLHESVEQPQSESDNFIPDSETLTTTIKFARKTNHKSLRETAKAAGISVSYLSKIERGEVKQPSLRVLNGLASALNINPNNLIKIIYFDSYSSIGLDSGVYLGSLEAAITNNCLTPREANELAAYLNFMRERDAKKLQEQ